MGQLENALAGQGRLVFDGAMGTMLQQSGLQPGQSPDSLCLSEPELITSIHRAYVEAGSQVVTTNTFGASSGKLAGAASVRDVYAAAVACARQSGAQYVAADIGPLGDLMYPMGDLEFSQAYELFAEQAVAAADAGADLVIIETMADVLEAVAAVMAVKGSCGLPVFATMTFTAQGRTFMGTSPRAAALTLASLGVDALGVNCSAGPADLQPVVLEMLDVSPVPVIVQANAGLPQTVDGRTVYTLAPEEYADAVMPMVEAGAAIVGGCCGTNPDYIRALCARLGECGAVVRLSERSVFAEHARELADEGGRDGEILETILDAGDLAALKSALAEEYDE